MAINSEAGILKKKGEKPKVLLITAQFAPDFGPSVPIYTALAQDLQKMGSNVTVITAFPHYSGSVGSFQKDGTIVDEERKNGLRILRTYVYKVPKNATWGRLLYHASFNIFSTLAALRVEKPDIVLADAPTLWSGLPLMIKAILPKIPFIYILHDLYPDVLFRLGVITNIKLIQMIERIERFFYDKAARISVLSDGFKQNLTTKGVPEDKISVIPVCVDVGFIQNVSGKNKLREKWGLENKFVVLYAGNIGLSQGLDVVIEAAWLLSEYPDIVFVIVGEGAEKQNLLTMANQKGLCNVRFYPFQPRQDVPYIYGLSHIGLVSLKRSIIVESVPSKTYTIMASGRPIIATVNRNTEIGCLFEQAQCGLCIEPENPKALVEAILRLHNDDALRRNMGRQGKDFVARFYSRQVAAKQYFSLIRQCLNGSTQ